MTIGAALVLIAAGAILRFAVATTSVYGVNLQIVGVILMIVGIVGVLAWAVIWAPWVRSRRGGYRAAPPPGEEHHIYRDDRDYYDQYRR